MCPYSKKCKWVCWETVRQASSTAIEISAGFFHWSKAETKRTAAVGGKACKKTEKTTQGFQQGRTTSVASVQEPSSMKRSKIREREREREREIWMVCVRVGGGGGRGLPKTAKSLKNTRVRVRGVRCRGFLLETDMRWQLCVISLSNLSPLSCCHYCYCTCLFFFFF